VIRNVCIHVSNEQPLLADLFHLPSAADVGLLCTNVRSLDGKRPVFIDNTDATFFFPYHIIRFLEIPQGAWEPGREPAREDQPPIYVGAPGQGSDEPASLLPVLVTPPPEDPDGDDGDAEIEIDEAFMQRIRDI
jgi:hypothetical protein